jgi:hypothetical protein
MVRECSIGIAGTQALQDSDAAINRNKFKCAARGSESEQAGFGSFRVLMNICFPFPPWRR